jgi:hypothetical protein
MEADSAAQSAIRKLEEFYNGLEPDERRVIALIVSASMQRAARAQGEREWLVDGEVLLELITPEYTPVILTDIGAVVAGQLAPSASQKESPLE